MRLAPTIRAETSLIRLSDFLEPSLYLPGYAPELNPDELVWSHVKRIGTGKKPLRAGEQLQPRIDADLRALRRTPALIRSFFKAPSVAYISD